MKTYPEGKLFNGRIGRTWRESEPSFPVRPRAPAGAPNVLYIVLDDVGYGWSDTFGGLVETPTITHLARSGLRYTGFHTTGLGAPTRACLLTGRNHHSVGMGNVTELATGFPGYNARQTMDKAGIGAIMRTVGYSTFAVGKWHGTPAEESGPTGPFDRWPTGPIHGFDRFYGFMGGHDNNWYPKLFSDNTPIDQPATPDAGYHLSQDLTDRAIELIANKESVDPDKPWLLYLAYGAGHAPHHAPRAWADHYRGRFDLGWDDYREEVLARQKALGVVPENTVLAPMDGVERWGRLSDDERRLYARMAEVFAGFVSHADAQIGRIVEFLDRTGDLDNTLIFVFVGDNGSSAEGTPGGLFNEMCLAAGLPETLDFKLQRIDGLGLPGAYNHYPSGWALAGNTPFRYGKQSAHEGGTHNPLVIHWPKGICARDEIRPQLCHAIDIVPTILEVVGLTEPASVGGVAQAPIEGVSMRYSFDDAGAPTYHPVQYFEMLGDRAIIDGRWKAVTASGRLPWETRSRYPGVDEQEWELYDLEADPAEAHDLVPGHDLHDASDPVASRLVQLVDQWWAEAAKYGVLPLDDRLDERLDGRGDAYAHPRQMTFYPGAVRIPEESAPDTKNRSWSMTAHIEVPPGGAAGPICAMGGETNGWSLYVKDGRVAFCYNLAGAEITTVRASRPLGPGMHAIRFEFERTGREPAGAGGIGRLFVDGHRAGEKSIPRTVAYGYSLDETFDVGCDKGSPVTPDYAPLATFTGRIAKIDFDLGPTFAEDIPAQHDAELHAALIRE